MVSHTTIIYGAFALSLLASMPVFGMHRARHMHHPRVAVAAQNQVSAVQELETLVIEAANAGNLDLFLDLLNNNPQVSLAALIQSGRLANAHQEIQEYLLLTQAEAPAVQPRGPLSPAAAKAPVAKHAPVAAKQAPVAKHAAPVVPAVKAPVAAKQAPVVKHPQAPVAKHAPAAAPKAPVAKHVTPAPVVVPAVQPAPATAKAPVVVQPMVVAASPAAQPKAPVAKATPLISAPSAKAPAAPAVQAPAVVAVPKAVVKPAPAHRRAVAKQTPERAAAETLLANAQASGNLEDIQAALVAVQKAIEPTVATPATPESNRMAALAGTLAAYVTGSVINK